MNYKKPFYVTLVLLILAILYICIGIKIPPVTPPVSETINEAVKLKKNLLRTLIASGLDIKGNATVVDSSTGKVIKPCKDGPVIVDDENYPDIKQEKTKNKTSKNSSDCLVQIVNPSKLLRSALEASESNLEGIVKKEGKKIPAKFVSQLTAIYDGSICRTHHVGGNQHTLCIKETDLCEDMLEDAIYYDDQELIDEVKEDCEV